MHTIPRCIWLAWSSDSFTLCIAQREGERCVVDVLREVRPPFSPDDVTREFAELCRAYGVSKVVGDQYGAAWVSERFHSHGLRYEASPLPSRRGRRVMPLLRS